MTRNNPTVVDPEDEQDASLRQLVALLVIMVCMVALFVDIQA